MSASSTSSTTPEQREYVQAYGKRHPIWRAAFWQESFYRAVRDEVGKLIDPLNASNSRLTSIFAAEDAAGAAADAAAAAAAGGAASGAESSADVSVVAGPARAAVGSGGSGSSAPVSAWAAMIGSDGDAQYAYSQIVFGQLMALVVNMLSFDVPSEEVRATVQRLAIGNGLSKDYIFALLDTVAAQRQSLSLDKRR